MMTADDAETYLKSYRTTLKAWTMAVAGFSNGDSDSLYQQLESGQDHLVQIALDHPQKCYSIDMLINSRSRTWAGYAADRLPRPLNRQT